MGNGGRGGCSAVLLEGGGCCLIMTVLLSVAHLGLINTPLGLVRCATRRTQVRTIMRSRRATRGTFSWGSGGGRGGGDGGGVIKKCTLQVLSSQCGTLCE